MTAPAPHSQPTTGCLSAEDREDLDAVYIAHIKRENASLKARIEELEGALRFYRDGWNCKTHAKRAGLTWHPKEELLDDCGEVARAALNPTGAA